MCCSPWVCKESDMTEWLKWTELRGWLMPLNYSNISEIRGVLPYHLFFKRDHRKEVTMPSRQMECLPVELNFRLQQERCVKSRDLPVNCCSNTFWYSWDIMRWDDRASRAEDWWSGLEPAVKVSVPSRELPASVGKGFSNVQDPMWRLHFPPLSVLASGH